MTLVRRAADIHRVPVRLSHCVQYGVSSIDGGWSNVVASHPSAGSSTISFYDMVLFVDLAHHLAERIRWNQRGDVTGPPIDLPISVHNFRHDALEAQDHLVKSLWSSLRQLVWADTFIPHQ
jgi:hypothetical protein